MIPKRSKKKKPPKLFVMNAKVLKKRKKPPRFSPFTREKAVRLALIFVVFATCGFGGVEVGRYLLSDPKYAVKHIIVRGNQRLSKEEIIRLSSLEKGDNIFRCRIRRAQDRLIRRPLIKHASVSRFMPDILVVEVIERLPRARLSGPNELIADYSGVVLPPSSCSNPKELPLILGAETADLEVGERCLDPAVIKAMRVLQLCEFSGLAGVLQIESIECSGPTVSCLRLRSGDYTQDDCEVRIEGDDFEQKLANLAVICQSVVAKHGKKIRWISQTKDRAYVRF
jgi:hypothetical protein